VILLFAFGKMSNRQANQQRGAMGGASAELCGGTSDSSDEGGSSASAHERLVRRYHRHAFIDLLVPANSTCVGYVDAVIGIVWIAKLCGKVISQQSLRSRDGCRTLSLIDSLYALERGALLLRAASPASNVQALCASGDVENGSVVSIQEMWCLVMSSGVGLEQYVVYRSLRDHGYAVFPQSAAQGALAVMHAVKAGSSTTVLVFSVRAPAAALMRCVSLLPGAELRSLKVEPCASAAPQKSTAAASEAAPHSADAVPLVSGSVLALRSACAAAVVDGTDVTWLGFDPFE
jgi:hypothetical protein